MKRVVTGFDAHGNSAVLHEGPPPVESTSPTRRAINVWFTDETPAPLTAGPAETVDRPYKIAPSAGGTCFRIYEQPPDKQFLEGRSAEEIKNSFIQASGGNYYSTKADSPHPLMHQTETVDYGIILEGEIFLLVGDREVHLKQGDVIVQRGASHAWSNRSDSVCRMAFVVLDAKFATELKAGAAS